LVKEATFLWGDGTPIDFSALPNFLGQTIPKPGGVLGSPLAGAPSFQGNIHARYEIAFNGYNAFAQIGAVHQSHSLATTDKLTRDLQGHFTANDCPLSQPMMRHSVSEKTRGWCKSMERTWPTRGLVSS